MLTATVNGKRAYGSAQWLRMGIPGPGVRGAYPGIDEGFFDVPLVREITKPLRDKNWYKIVEGHEAQASFPSAKDELENLELIRVQQGEAVAYVAIRVVRRVAQTTPAKLIEHYDFVLQIPASWDKNYTGIVTNHPVAIYRGNTLKGVVMPFRI